MSLVRHWELFPRHYRRMLRFRNYSGDSWFRTVVLMRPKKHFELHWSSAPTTKSAGTSLTCCCKVHPSLWLLSNPRLFPKLKPALMNLAQVGSMSLMTLLNSWNLTLLKSLKLSFRLCLSTMIHSRQRLWLNYTFSRVTLPRLLKSIVPFWVMTLPTVRYSLAFPNLRHLKLRHQLT